MTKIAPYGTWKSPIGTDALTAKSISLGPVEAQDGRLFWPESRPAEGGRTTLMMLEGTPPDSRQKPRELVPAPYNIRSQVHEYGGTAHIIAGNTVYFVNLADQRLYRLPIGETNPVAITPESDTRLRYADLVYDAKRARIICIAELHSADGSEPENRIVAIDCAGEIAEPATLVAGADFYAWPRLDGAGDTLAWVSWNHPNMPWDGTVLFRAPLNAAGKPGAATSVAGGENISIFQPEWSPSGDLHYVSDETGWWNLYRDDKGKTRALAPIGAEFGLPLWSLGTRSYCFLPDGGLLCAYFDKGEQHFGLIEGGTLTPFPTPFRMASLPVPSGDDFIATGAGRSRATLIGRFDRDGNLLETLKSATDQEMDAADISVAEAITFPTGQSQTAHGWFYRPQNSAFAAPEEELPPLLVLSHGGPTGMADDAFKLEIQFWTSRGFAVADINYRGSTGFGRAYRQQLDGQWGIADVEDCVAAADYLARQQRVDGKRMAIRGGSAGGFTTLCALTFHDVFRAGAVRYGIGDLMALARDTHKFEARYLDRLVAPLPEGENVYAVRSPLNFTERLNCPVIFFQGLDDKVVPPNQAEEMVKALRDKGLPVAYIAFEGEGHGFRKAENIKHMFEAELYFYAKVFGFEAADDIIPVEIENLQDENGNAG